METRIALKFIFVNHVKRMKIRKSLSICLVVVICMTAFIQLLLVRPALKSELDEMLNDAINIEMVGRLKFSSVHHQMGVYKSSTNNAKKVGIHIVTDIKNEFIPFGDTIRQENIIFNHNILLQSGLRTFSPLDVVKVDKILNSILLEKGLSAKTSIRYLDKQDSCQYFSKRGYWFEIQSSVIEMGIKKEMEVQAFILPSVSWMLKTLSGYVKISYLLFVILSFLLLFYYHWKQKRVKVVFVADTLDGMHITSLLELSIEDSKTDETREKIIREIPVYIEKMIRKLDNGDYQIGSFHLDVFRKCLMKDNYCRYIGKRKEYILLQAFLKAQNHCLSSQKIADILDIRNYKFNNQLNAAVTRLRALLKMDPDIEIVFKNEKYTLILSRSVSD